MMMANVVFNAFSFRKIPARTACTDALRHCTCGERQWIMLRSHVLIMVDAK